MNLTADGQTVMENRYRYDAVDNILGITNAANPTSLTKLNKAKLGGRSSHTYEYDELNRLVHASGKAKRASYDMVMSFGRMSEPLTKVQKVDSTTTAKSYNFAYKYEDSNHPTAPTQIGHDHYTYDANGNPTLVTNDSANTTREMYWDEDNRLMVLSDNGKTSRYTYNAAGERIMKSYGTMEGVYINGAPQGITFHETDNFTLYPASILSVNKNRFTKHYFIGDKRVASRIGTGLFNNVYGRNGSYVTAGQQDYAERMNQIQTQKEAYYKKVGVAPGVPTEKGAYGDPENTGVGYNAVLTELGNHDVPQGWIQTPHPNTTPGTNPGAPVSWNDPSNPDDPQAGYGYIPNDTTKEETFFYHSDHLGSTSYITDDHANITQYDAYLPYGELLVDEHSSSEDLPYKFNGKQFDEETGLYYYGARYLNPMASIWYGVDPLAEKYSMMSGYVYTFANPIKLIDPDGRKVVPTLYVNNGNTPVSSYHSPQRFSKAMRAFAKTTYGRKVLADFTEKGKTIFGVKGNGKYADYDLVLQEESFTGKDQGQNRANEFINRDDGSWIAAQTRMTKDKNGKPKFTIIFDLSYSSDELTETITHEFSVHLHKYSEVLDTFKKNGSYKAAYNLWNSTSAEKEHHDLIQKYPNLQGTKLYRATKSELIEQNSNLKKIFDNVFKEYKKNY